MKTHSPKYNPEKVSLCSVHFAKKEIIPVIAVHVFSLMGPMSNLMKIEKMKENMSKKRSLVLQRRELETPNGSRGVEENNESEIAECVLRKPRNDTSADAEKSSSGSRKGMPPRSDNT